MFNSTLLNTRATFFRCRQGLVNHTFKVRLHAEMIEHVPRGYLFKKVELKRETVSLLLDVFLPRTRFSALVEDRNDKNFILIKLDVDNCEWESSQITVTKLFRYPAPCIWVF